MVWGMLLPTGEITVNKFRGEIKSVEYIKAFRKKTQSQFIGTQLETNLCSNKTTAAYMFRRKLCSFLKELA